MRKTKYIGIAAAALMLVSGVMPGFNSGIFSADNTLVKVSASYISSGLPGSKFSYVVDTNTYDTFLYLSVLDEKNKTAAIAGSGFRTENTSIFIPETATFHGVEYKITEIADNAFKGQTNLVSVSGMKNVTKIGDRAFYNCTSLNEISITGYNRSGINKVEVIGNEAFYNCNLLNRVRFNSVSNIGNSAFENCWNLSEVDLEGAPLKNISSYAFNSCGMLQNITLPEGLEMIGDCAFKSCQNLKIIDIPESVRNINSYAFEFCRSLKTAFIPDNIQYIGDYAFYGCDVMNYFVCKNPNASIGNQAIGFDYNRYYSGPKSNFMIWGKGGNIQNYAVNNGFTYNDCSKAPSIAKEKIKPYQWNATNMSKESWADPANGKYYFTDSHRKYVSDEKQSRDFKGSCFGLAFVSAMTYNGYINVDDYCPGYSTISSVPKDENMPSFTKSFVNTIWASYSDYAQWTPDFQVYASNFYDKKMIKYAEYITYGADAAVCVISGGVDSTHAIVCYGLEYKEDASDRYSNKQWNNMDARILVYDVNETSTPMTSCYYVNFSTGEWGSGQLYDSNSKFKEFKYSKKNTPFYFMRMLYNPDHMISRYEGEQNITGLNLMYEILYAGK